MLHHSYSLSADDTIEPSNLPIPGATARVTRWTPDSSHTIETLETAWGTGQGVWFRLIGETFERYATIDYVSDHRANVRYVGPAENGWRGTITLEDSIRFADIDWVTIQCDDDWTL